MTFCEQQNFFVSWPTGNKALRLCVVFKIKHSRMEKPPKIHVHKMKAGGQKVNTTLGWLRRKTAEQNCFTPQTSAGNRKFLSRRGNKQETAAALSLSNVNPSAHVPADFFTAPRKLQNQPPLHGAAERVDTCECSRQLARDARRILQLNKKLTMQL